MLSSGASAMRSELTAAFIPSDKSQVLANRLEEKCLLAIAQLLVLGGIFHRSRAGLSQW
jgi:hypothetical protein